MWMFKSAHEYLQKLNEKQFTTFTLTGPTEVGKTFLNKDIKRFVLKYPHLFKFPIREQQDEYLIYSTLSELVQKLMDSPKYLFVIKRCGILFVEEFLSFRAMNAWSEVIIEKAFEILNSRSEKATVIDTNKSIKDLKEIDIRIHSRLLRNDGMLLDIPNDTTPYLSR